VIETTYQDGVAVLAMRHGKVNALDTALCQALCGALDQAADRAQAVVLTGTGTVFPPAWTCTGCSPGRTNT
jgi:enoyl-CoA hydratase